MATLPPDGDDDATSSGKARPNGAGNGGSSDADAALGADPGEAEIAARIAAFHDELALIRWDHGIDGDTDTRPLLEKYRLNSCRVAVMLREDGPALALPFRIAHRRSFGLICKLIAVCEADLPPETAP